MPYFANSFSNLRCVQQHTLEGDALDSMEGDALDSMLVADTNTATLAWLVSALEQARREGQSKAIGYLEAVAEDVVFEMEMAARR